MPAVADEVVPGMAEAVEARRKELGLSPVELARQAGVSMAGLGPIRKGYRRAYQERLTRPVCRALRWTDDSIDRLLRGEPAEAVASEPEVDDLSRLRDEVERQGQRIQDLSRLVADLLGARLASGADRPGDSTAG